MESEIFLYPENGYLLVERQERQAKEEMFVVRPANINDKERIPIVKLIRTAPESKFSTRCGQKMFVLGTMIEVVEYKDHKYLLVPEQAVFGFLFDESSSENSKESRETQDAAEEHGLGC